jgi:hypothetical protein
LISIVIAAADVAQNATITIANDWIVWNRSIFCT